MPSPIHLSIRRHLILGAALIFVLFGVVGGWAATTRIAGAVIAQGVLVVVDNVKQIQHPEGGVISTILVREGDHVSAGQTLIQLDATKANSNLQIILKRIDEILARQARDEAEQASNAKIVFPAELLFRSSDPDARKAMDGETLAFNLRRASREGQKAQLTEKIGELDQTILGLQQQILAIEQQLALIDEDLEGIEALLQKKLVTKARSSDLKRQKANARGELGRLISAVAEAKGRIAALHLEKLQIDHDVRQTASQEISEARTQLSELIERRAAATEELDRSTLKAPLDGVIHKLAVHTVGGVVRPNETVLQIVPSDEKLVVEARITPRDVNDVHQGQKATLRFSGVNQRTTPDISGTVQFVSADIDQDERSGQGYYSTRIAVPAEELSRLMGLRPMPGMPVEAFITTQDRTVLTFLTEPLTDQISRAFRDK
ncbi:MULTISPECIES: HlyD family type I secretion periplasmic adaptor subunit [unclassified Aureimonas]|uniref:HlyD family type I secretion periplasmic adaptor subunit n=1 Tax=unclassified Aureimonas TaxID=2615206 RepID=UPI0006F1CEE2|nr:MULTISPECIES: HlyD family type I secretion periplasmic adaptor subunit [unclassified Aureimonas]KQT61790.1 hypothetical protein ASG62_23955 [Aureimonas sp. Leaf427]KQT62223.1 hypothetical protein ASG54_23225 [Aureimonas sp. Leaf460]